MNHLIKEFENARNVYIKLAQSKEKIDQINRDNNAKAVAAAQRKLDEAISNNADNATIREAQKNLRQVQQTHGGGYEDYLKDAPTREKEEAERDAAASAAEEKNARQTGLVVADSKDRADAKKLIVQLARQFDLKTFAKSVGGEVDSFKEPQKFGGGDKTTGLQMKDLNSLKSLFEYLRTNNIKFNGGEPIVKSMDFNRNDQSVIDGKVVKVSIPQ